MRANAAVDGANPSGGVVLRRAVFGPLVLCVACTDAGDPATTQASPPGWFVEQAQERGLDFAHESGASGDFLMPEIMCGGAALFDMDADGDLDVYLVQSGGIDDCLQIPYECVEGDVGNVPVREPITALVIPDQRVILRKLLQQMTPHWALPVVFEVV